MGGFGRIYEKCFFIPSKSLALFQIPRWYKYCCPTVLTFKTLVMTLIGFLVLLIIAAICGAIGQSLAGYDLGGCLVSIVVGFVGAWLGLWIAGKFGLPEIWTVNIEGKPFPIIWAIIGSAIFTLIVALLRRAFIGRRY